MKENKFQSFDPTKIIRLATDQYPDALWLDSLNRCNKAEKCNYHLYNFIEHSSELHYTGTVLIKDKEESSAIALIIFDKNIVGAVQYYEDYDPTWLVELALYDYPDDLWIADALKKCTKIRKEGRWYFNFYSEPPKIKPSPAWKGRGIWMDGGVQIGQICVDFDRDNFHISGIEFVTAVCNSELYDYETWSKMFDRVMTETQTKYKNCIPDERPIIKNIGTRKERKK